MAKYEFEWDDAQVLDMQLVLGDLLKMNIPPSRRSMLHDMVNKIREQKPVPLPTKLSAVIRVLPSAGPVQHGAAGRVATRMQPGRTDGGLAWIVSDGPMDAYWLADHELAGLRFEVLFEGVDL